MEFIYDDEKLPELEVEELLTLEEMLQHQPSFVAFTKDEINVLLQQLLDSTQKADTFHRMHTELLKQKQAEGSLLEKLILQVAAERKVYDEQTGDDDSFKEEMDKAKNAPNYTLQQVGVNRVMLPFKKPAVDEGAASMEVSQVRADIILSDGSRSTLLAEDPISVAVQGAQWAARRPTPYDYVFDRPPEDLRETPMVARDATTSDITTWIQKFVRPTFASVIEDIPDTYSLHDVQRILGRFGYDWNNLTLEELKQLQEILLTLVMPRDSDQKLSTEEQQQLRKTLVIPSPSLTPSLSMQDVAKNVQVRLHSLLTEIELQRLEDMYAVFLQSVPPLPGTIPLMEPHEIVRQLHDSTITLEEVQEQLQQWYHRWNIDIATRFMEKRRQTQGADEVQGTLQGYIDMITKRLAETGKEGKNRAPFLSWHREIASIKEGNDTMMYDGNPMSALSQVVFEELGEITMDVVGEEDNILEEDVDAPLPDGYDAYDIALPVEVEKQHADLTTGAKEVLGCVWTRMHRIQQASGLPGDMKTYLDLVKKRVSRSARIDQLKAHAPQLSTDILASVITSDLGVSMGKIRDLQIEDAVLSRLLEEYPVVHKEWEKACHDALSIMLTEWWLDMLRQSIAGTLDFTVSVAMMQHIGLWSPFGAPVEDGNNARTGILPYLAAVVETIYPHMTKADALEKAMMQIATEMFDERVKQLKEMWATAQDQKKTLDRAALAKVSLMEAIMAIKSKQRVNIIPTYIQALLYLPGVLPAKKQVAKAQRWVQGCCATKLDESFEADKDWKDTWRDLHMIKQGLAKKRWSQDPRPPLRMFVEARDKKSAAKESSADKMLPNLVQDDEISSTKEAEFLMKQTWISKTHMDMLIKKPMDVAEWSKNIIARVFNRTKVPSIIQALDILSSSTSLLLSWIARVALLLPSSLEHLIVSVIGPMKAMLRTLRNGSDVKYILTYCFTVVCALPSTLQGASVIDPANITIQETGTIRDGIHRICVEYNKNGLAMTSQDIQKYITKKREQQKQISLAKMDILTTEDRKLLQDAKKLKLVKLAETSELQDTVEIDAIFEFRMRSTDEDEKNIEKLDD